MPCCSPSRRTPLHHKVTLLALTLFLVFPAISEARAAEKTLVFYADKQVKDTLWLPLFSAIRDDLAKEAYGLASDNLRLMRGSEVFPGEEFGSVIGVKLLGRCDVPQQAYRPLKPGPLGWVLRVHGEIQPYIYIDCTRMAQVLDPTTLGMSTDQRSRAMSQAISHVLVHEWIHIATQNSAHAVHGISEAQLSANTLVAEPATSHSVIEATEAEKPSSILDRTPIGLEK